MAPPRHPRRCDESSAVRPCRDRPLLAGMGVLVDLHGRIGAHYCLSLALARNHLVNDRPMSRARIFSVRARLPIRLNGRIVV
jgi:hypothetical protein